MRRTMPYDNDDDGNDDNAATASSSSSITTCRLPMPTSSAASAPTSSNPPPARCKFSMRGASAHIGVAIGGVGIGCNDATTTVTAARYVRDGRGGRNNGRGVDPATAGRRTSIPGSSRR